MFCVYACSAIGQLQVTSMEMTGSSSLAAETLSIAQEASEFGEFRDSTSEIDQPLTLRSRLQQDGYLFIRDIIDRDALAEVEKVMIDALHARNVIDPASDRVTPLRVRPGGRFYMVMDEISQHASLRSIARTEELLQLFADIFEEPAKTLDYIWPRAAGPGGSEHVHCDWVYMSRGSERLMTTWIPVVDVPIERGPLMILEHSHRPSPRLRKYMAKDVDSLGFFDGLRLKHGRLVHGGRYSSRPARVQREFGTRWLTADFKAGDLIIFDPRCLHATLVNRTDEFRLSMDTRFQPAADPMDPRYAGTSPPLRSRRSKSLVDYLLALRDLALAARARVSGAEISGKPVVARPPPVNPG
jgi:ectoine hydroxylase-related dioxygenase (phytanoyl-CoA dioxygenase family)